MMKNSTIIPRTNLQKSCFVRDFYFQIFLFFKISWIHERKCNTNINKISLKRGIWEWVAKSIIRAVRVVHLLLRTRNFFQLTCPWTSKKSYTYLCVCFQMIATKIESLQTYYYFISEIRIIVKVLQKVYELSFFMYTHSFNVILILKWRKVQWYTCRLLRLSHRLEPWSGLLAYIQLNCTFCLLV